jgi:hypothetical protein
MRKLTKIFILIIFGFFISTNIALALEGQRDLSIQLSNFLGFTTVSGIAEYVGTIYTIMMGLAGGIASFMMIVAGFQYATAFGDKGKIDKAKKRIFNSVVGLFLIFGAYFILNTINPAILSMHIPEIKTIERNPMNTFSQMGVESGTFSCDTQSTNDVAIPLGENQQDWCTTHCSEFYTGSEVLRGNDVEGQETRNCCHCSVARAGVTPPTRTAGAPVDCVVTMFASGVSDEQKRTACANFSGTDGQCTVLSAEDYNTGLTAVGNSCQWEGTRCSADEDCARAGSVHCWGGYCFQQQLENGDPCWRINEACLSGSCNGLYCARSAAHNDEIPIDGLCSNGPEECQSGVCATHPGTLRDTKQCN